MKIANDLVIPKDRLLVQEYQMKHQSFVITC